MPPVALLGNAEAFQLKLLAVLTEPMVFTRSHAGAESPSTCAKGLIIATREIHGSRTTAPKLDDTYPSFHVTVTQRWAMANVQL
jgi:hypothetical protein